MKFSREDFLTSLDTCSQAQIQTNTYDKQILKNNQSPNPSQKTRPNINYQKEKTCHLVDFAIPVDHKIKIKANKRIKQIYGSYQRAEKAIEHDGNTNYGWCPGNSPQKHGKEIRGTGDQRKY